MRTLLMTAALALMAGPAAADDAALILGAERYRTLDRVIQGSDVVDAAPDLAALGYTVFSAANPTAQDMRQAARRWYAEVDDADRLIVVLSGRFVTDGPRTWFLSSDVRDPSVVDLPLHAMSVDLLARVMEAAQGQALLVLAHEDNGTELYARPLRLGIGSLREQQGVTIVTGPPGAVSTFVDQIVTRPGADVLQAVRENRRLRLRGYAPPQLVLGTGARVQNRSAQQQANLAADRRDWQSAVRTDTIPGYRAYLDDHADGLYAQQARAAIEAIRSEPNRAARLAEEAIGLSRADRRAIQRNLNILNYNTRGIDGIFGSGTRQAITNWQQQSGLSQTSYLNPNQISRLARQAEVRAAELAAAAERQRRRAEQEDRAFWQQMGANGSEEGMQRYLQRYPDGLFVNQARETLAELEAEKRRRANAADRQAWDIARGANTIGAFRAYLERNPNGAFVANAQERIRVLRQDEDMAAANARNFRGEQALELDRITIRLIEAQLGRVGHTPGQVDGEIDGETRRAIRRFQRDADLEVTGYLSEETVVRLLVTGE